MGLMDWLCGCGGKRTKQPERNVGVPVEYIYKVVPQQPQNMEIGSASASPLGFPITPPPQNIQPVFLVSNPDLRPPTPPKAKHNPLQNTDAEDLDEQYELVYADATQPPPVQEGTSCRVS